MISRSIHLFTISARIVKSWIRFWPRWRSVPGNGEDKLLFTRKTWWKVCTKYVHITTKDSHRRFSGGTSCEMTRDFLGTHGFFLLSLDVICPWIWFVLGCFDLFGWVTWPTQRPLMVYGVWRRSCYLPAGCHRGMGCWRPIGKASRRPWISEHVGKGREMMDGWREPWRWMPWNWNGSGGWMFSEKADCNKILF